MSTDGLRKLLLIARHEFLQTAGNRVFLLTLVLLPFIIVVSGLVPRWIAEEAIAPPTVAIADFSGRIESRMRAQLASQRARDELAALARWMRLNLADRFLKNGRPDPDRIPALLLKHRSQITTRDIAAFQRRGGLAGLLPIAMAFVRTDARSFVAPPPDFLLVPLPPELVQAMQTGDITRLREQARPYLNGRRRLPDGRRLDVLAVIPPRITLLSPDDPALFARPDPEHSLQLWSAGTGAERVADNLREAATAVLRHRRLEQAGMTPAIQAALAASLPVQRIDLRSRAGHERRPADVIRDFLPRAFAFALIYFLLLQASLLMGHMAEERQSRVLEMLVSTVSPQTLLGGKLIGGAAISLLSLTALLSLTLLALRLLGPGEVVLVLRVVGEALAEPGLLVLLISQFLLGFLFFAGLFVVAGAFAVDQRSSQLLVMPLMLLMFMMIPVVIVLGDDPTSTAARIASYLPGIGPFMIVARHDAGLGLGTILLAGMTQILAIAGVLWVAGHLFRMAILEGGIRNPLRQWRAMVRAPRRAQNAGRTGD
ncbi:MAG: hypothetical protein D6740_11640 [Alphaproteobacteria bacterium]|nr:MAG: hypothetical protein D6740_11640 [Alphaproteobacteria bacterium]